MTREEKISHLKDILSEINENDDAVCYLTSEDNELIESAIEALEQQPCEDKIIEWKKDFKEYVNSLSMLNDDYKGIMEYIDELPVTPQQPCEDAISMMDLLNNLHKHFPKGFETDEWWNSTHVLQAVKDCRPELFDLNYVPPVQLKPIECEDAISRKNIEKLKRWRFSYDTNTTIPKSDLFVKLVDIRALPLVQPKIKTGHWIDDEFGSKCSCCGIHTHLDKFDKPMKFKYCSMCGAKMIEPQKSEET